MGKSCKWIILTLLLTWNDLKGEGQQDGDFGDDEVDDGASAAVGPIDTGILVDGINADSGAQIQAAIVGGLPVPPHKYPFMVSLQYRTGIQKGNHFCGGSLISSIHIITAAHCIQSLNTTDIQAGIGLHRRRTNDTSHLFRIKSIHIHKEFNSSQHHIVNDIALLTLSISIANKTALKTGTITLPRCALTDPRPATLMVLKVPSVRAMAVARYSVSFPRVHTFLLEFQATRLVGAAVQGR
ncbi:hypothetical protein BV898_10789 [Hypsibius exemplaris]|uniref:Peptidase S1 domain-containing protein n=1 Tax=Hypsibius exemplaris TaxID=2072580 RepID=A0A1W0WIJ2_HYPEX|nr:hypothetical protein BV898_10789 [Hypsibius exemplaris]